jgi:hypothetical protein
MSFLTPKWDSAQNNYVIDVTEALQKATQVGAGKDNTGSTVFRDGDRVHNTTVEVLHRLIDEGETNKWFTKLPSHEQLMKRVKHSFSSLGNSETNTAVLERLLMTPKLITFVWTPTTVKVSKPSLSRPPPMQFEDSDDEGLTSEPEVSDSNLPPVELVNDAKRVHEEYLLSRLRAAKARVEEEQIRMQYFEATGKMPPESEDEDEDEDTEEEE